MEFNEYSCAPCANRLLTNSLWSTIGATTYFGLPKTLLKNSYPPSFVACTEVSRLDMIRVRLKARRMRVAVRRREAAGCVQGRRFMVMVWGDMVVGFGAGVGVGAERFCWCGDGRWLLL